MGRIGGLTDPRSRKAVEVAERYADGEATDDELETARAVASSHTILFRGEDVDAPSWIAHICTAQVTESVVRAFTNYEVSQRVVPPTVQTALLRDIFGNPYRKPTCGWRTVTAAKDMSARALESGTSEESVWWGDWCINSTVLGLAQSIYESRDFSRMPVLADCLEEAGCENGDILMHCRGMERCPDCFDGDEGTCVYCERCGKNGGAGRMGWIRLRGLHVRGCWVLDLLTGRE